MKKFLSPLRLIIYLLFLSYAISTSLNNSFTPYTPATIFSLPKNIIKEYPFKLMSYNVRCASDHLRNNKNGSFIYRSSILIQNVLKILPDTIGFQEVTSSNSQANWYYLLKRGLNSEYKWVGEERDQTNMSEACPIFYNFHKLILLSYGTKWLSETPNIKGSRFLSTKDHPTDGLPRVFTYIIVKNRLTGIVYMHINTHLDYKEYINRRYQVKVLMNFIEKIRELYKIPVFITGDFNSENLDIDKQNEDAVPYMIKHGYIDASEESLYNEDKDHWTWPVSEYFYVIDKCKEKGVHANGKSFYWQSGCDSHCDKLYRKIIDYCLRYREDKSKFIKYKVLHDLKEDEVIASDHYALMIEGYILK